MGNNLGICTECRKVKLKIAKAKASIAAETDLMQATELFKLLGNHSRLKIILSLQQVELCVNEIAELLQLSMSSTSQHLKILRDNQLLKSRSEGTQSFYSIGNEKIGTIIKMAQPGSEMGPFFDKKLELI